MIALAAVLLLGAGGFAGVRHYLANRGGAVDVISVSEINQASWISGWMDSSTSGTVVSDVSQNVSVPQDKTIKDVYVSEGDQVKIGDKLLSYDTTLLELDLESQQLSIQELELEMKTAQKDLAKLQNTTPVAKSSSDDSTTADTSSIWDRFSSTDGDYGSDSDDSARLVSSGQDSVTAQELSADGGGAQEPDPAEAAVQPESVEESQAPATEENVIDPGADTEESSDTGDGEYLLPEQLDTAGASGETEKQTESGQEQEMQSLKDFLKNVRIREVTDAGENLLADTAQTESADGDPVTAQLSGADIKLVPHFSETAAAHFETGKTYALLIRGVQFAEEKSGDLYGTALIDGNDYPKIGSWTLKMDPTSGAADAARLTITFDAGLDAQHALAAELADVYAEIPLKASEVTGTTLTVRTADAASDLKIALSGNAQTEPETESETEPESETETGTETETDTETNTEIQTDTETETGIETETETETNTEPGTETETGSETGSETETETETGTETETETETESETGNLRLEVQWFHNGNPEENHPKELTLHVDAQTADASATVAEWQLTAEKNAREDQAETEVVLEEESAEPDEIWEAKNYSWDVDTLGDPTTAAQNAALFYSIYSMEPDNAYTKRYTMAEPVWTSKTDADGNTVFNCVISITYDDPYEALTELNYESGTEEAWYKGSGTEDDPYMFLCADGVVIKNTFINWVLGFDAEGKNRIELTEDDPEAVSFIDKDGVEHWVRKGYYVRLVLREEDSISGNFLRSVGFNGTIFVDEGYADNVYWIFTSENGLVKYVEEDPEPDPDPDPGWDDPDGGDDGTTYTAEELAQAIAEKKREIRKLELEQKTAELKLKGYEQDLESSTVTSAVNGYVKSLGGSTDGTEPYMVVASDSGLYLKTTVSELSLDTIAKGDTIQGQSWETGGTFSATITSITYFPEDSSGSDYYYYSSGNQNSSSYPVLAYIEDAEGLSQDESVSVSFPSTGSTCSVYLSPAYVRSENGQSYVYIADENGYLKKQYVRTGDTTNGYIGIKEGVTDEDQIAFPYGKNVKEGAKTQAGSSDNFIY